ncbi:fumarylacetoacetate hydrolase family protein [Streptomyces griseorubiginosus]|uniref:fumarylacetoacetate hydrolase family protein n=1 Tax=Streptomyces griseorubiginosus TaxID=67304 RepID=UPI001AD629E2|nr:fumarylacetoacetate hydrolase family protein [Streptomyces griseorubiginosus]MBO4254090.1 fumarylacetoacetate hydrolase [Streptomyces griseorubiginosus]
MRIGRLSGRLSILIGDHAIDVERASSGRFPADPDEVFERWNEFVEWAEGTDAAKARKFEPGELGSPVLRPAQVFAIGLNYRAHAAESGVDTPDAPTVFTKFRTSLTGPYEPVVLPTAGVDWEAELVAVIGRRAERVPEEEAWSYVAGLTAGQDLSERAVQLAGPVPQFSLGKSYPGFAPLGPVLVTPDEFDDPGDLEVSCSLDDEVLQKGRTSDMVFSVPQLVARLSAVCPLLPGDLIFTGTPPGVGMARTPQRYLKPGTTLLTAIEGIGELRNRLVAGNGYQEPR